MLILATAHRVRSRDRDVRRARVDDHRAQYRGPDVADVVGRDGRESVLVSVGERVGPGHRVDPTGRDRLRAPDLDAEETCVRRIARRVRRDVAEVERDLPDAGAGTVGRSR